jgi:hypothetical protein
MERAAHVKRGLSGALAVLAAGLLTVTALTAGASAHPALAHPTKVTAGCAQVGGPVRVGHFGGVLRPKAVDASCRVHNDGDPAGGNPPLLFHGGRVMGTASTGPLVVTPIYWKPAGHGIAAPYRQIVNTYLHNVASDSGTHTNVYSTAHEYSGSNGTIRYRVKVGAAILDTTALPVNGCTLAANDKTNIYSDNSGYNACLDDDQIISETESMVTSHGLARDLAHIYVMFLPKHVESCFYPGSTTTSSNQCTVNHNPSAAYCAYHSYVPGSGTVYANMPFPIYLSGTGYTCGSNATLPAIETPNGNADADTEVSPTSHEIMEAITDPDVSTGWFDASGYENGDECAYVYGATHGTAGQLYNQVIAGNHYLTQEEFSNLDFAATGGGCLQSE